MSILRPVYRIDLATAIGNKLIEAKGGYVKIVRASDQLATIKIAANVLGSQTTPFEMQEGDYINIGRGFDTLTYWNDAQANSWVEIQIAESQDEFDFVKARLGNIDNIVSPVMTTGGKKTENAAVSIGTTPSVVIPADDTITDWIYKNTDTVTQYAGGSAVTTADGFPIEPGETIAGQGRGGLWAVVAASTAVGRRIVNKVN